METRTVEQVNQWESRPFAGGLAGLRELADEGFSGAVEAAGTWAFALNGRVVGVFEGDLEDFEGRDGTAYRAPDQSLPLLFAMRELDGETQAKYYTNDTPLSEVHETLSSANFSGYVELSENVLSGDYYVVYYGGRWMSAAFVGESERLITDDEAFERADDEVGIYEVRKVDLDVIDLSEVVEEPEPEPDPEPEPEPEPSTAPDPEPSVDPEPEPDDSPESSDADDAPETPTREPARSEPDSPARQEPSRSEPHAPGEAEVESEPTPPSSEADPEPTPTRDVDGSPSPSPPASSGADSEPASAASGTESSSSSGRTQEGATTGSNAGGQQEVERTDDVFNEEQQWRQAKAIPSLDPGRSSDRAGAATATERRSKSPSTGGSTAKGASTSKSGSSEASGTKSKPSNSSKPSKTTERSAKAETVEKYEQALEDSKQEIEQLNERLSEAESEREELIAERDQLRSEVERLTAELEDARADDGTETPAGRSLQVDQALEGTNLFVRYASKSQPTLADARDGADREEVNANLSLEHHTQFEADETVVDGRAFETFLRESIQYRFVEWLIEDLLYEIRDTGYVGQLRELFDAIPEIDRAELDGNATIRKTEDGEEIRTQRSFDVILRDRMGNPLVVANINDDRDPATGDMMADLVAAANDVGETSDSLSAAVFVTASFFEPAALETAADATGGGLLSREKKESYVKLSRKRGYHLCLVETRGGQFHVNVPEL